MIKQGDTMKEAKILAQFLFTGLIFFLLGMYCMAQIVVEDCTDNKYIETLGFEFHCSDDYADIVFPANPDKNHDYR